MQKCSVIHLQKMTGRGQQKQRDQGMNLKVEQLKEK